MSFWDEKRDEGESAESIMARVRAAAAAVEDMDVDDVGALTDDELDALLDHEGLFRDARDFQSTRLTIPIEYDPDVEGVADACDHMRTG